MHQLYRHQAHAIREVLAGRDVVVVTPTASGKTMCYNLPVLSAILQNDDARALYLFPTKALSADQVSELLELIERWALISRRIPMTAIRRRGAKGGSAGGAYRRDEPGYAAQRDSAATTRSGSSCLRTCGIS